jgi:uncharacterized protein with GYD domain
LGTYIATGAYTPDGTAGLFKTGAVRRSEQLAAVAEGLGGRLVGMYFGLGQTDTFIILEFPDDITAAALAKTVNASGTGHCNMERILTPSELDQAFGIDTNFVKPGS